MREDLEKLSREELMDYIEDISKFSILINLFLGPTI